MNTSADGSGATLTEVDVKTLSAALTRYMLGALSADRSMKVAVITPFGYIAKSFTELHPLDVEKLFDMLGITLMGTPSTIADAISDGRLPPITTETVTETSGDSTASQSNGHPVLSINALAKGDLITLRDHEGWFNVKDLNKESNVVTVWNANTDAIFNVDFDEVESVK